MTSQSEVDTAIWQGRMNELEWNYKWNFTLQGSLIFSGVNMNENFLRRVYTDQLKLTFLKMRR